METNSDIDDDILNIELEDDNDINRSRSSIIEDVIFASPMMYKNESYQDGNPPTDTSPLQVFEDSPIVVHHSFFHIREHHENDFISVLDFSSQFVWIGTTIGSLYKIDNLGAVSKLNSTHASKITSLLIEENSIIISASEKGVIQIQSLKSEFDDIIINLGSKYPISWVKIKGT